MNPDNYQYWENEMRLLAKAAHKDQTRRDGITPYFEGHVERVASAVEDRLKPIALGHDLIEDTDITIEDLIRLGYPPYIIRAIDLLTHKEGVPNSVYWAGIASNHDATYVKIADIKHNLSDSPNERQKEKYQRALEFFKKKGYKTD
jgi:(p)ppGpp synthase/HD superfamily hydrolase